MRKLAGLTLFTLSTLCAQTPSWLESEPRGWKEITPNPSLKGWTRVPVPKTEALKASGWRVDRAAKVLLCEGDKMGHEMLRYDRELTDFIVHAEWRFRKLEGNPRYNSGVYVRNSADGTVWHQAQTGSSSGGFLFADTLTGGEKKRVNLRDQLKENRVKPAGEWNVYEIRCQGPKITLWVNGAVTSEYDRCEVPKGYVALEAEGFPIEFRNLRLKELRSR